MLGAAENALLEALKTHRDVRRLVRVVETLPKLVTEELLKRYYADAPALYLVPGRFTVQDDAAVIRFTVAGVVRNVAGQAQARKGDGIDIGCDHLAILAIRALNAQRIGACSWSVVSGQMVDDEIFDAAGIAAIELELQSSPVELPFDYGEEQMAELADFTRFHADIDVHADAGVIEYDSWLAEPPDFSTSAPDAQLDVQLPGAT